MEQAILATLGSTSAFLVTLILYLDRSHRAALESHRQETKADLESHRQETKADLESHRQETRADLESLRGAVVALEVQGSETRAALEALRAETRAGFQRVAELTQAVLDLAHRVGRLEGRMDNSEETAHTNIER